MRPIPVQPRCTSWFYQTKSRELTRQDPKNDGYGQSSAWARYKVERVDNGEYLVLEGYDQSRQAASAGGILGLVAFD